MSRSPSTLMPPDRAALRRPTDAEQPRSPLTTPPARRRLRLPQRLRRNPDRPRPFAGGRAARTIARGLVVVSFLVLAAAGVLAILDAFAPDTVTAAAPELADTYPTTDAAAFGIRAGVAWLRLDGAEADTDVAGPEVRQELLADVTSIEGDMGHIAPVDTGFGMRPTAVTVAGVDPIDEYRAKVTLTVQITGLTAPQWIHLAVPVSHDGQGGWSMSGTPVFMPKPPVIDVVDVERPPADTALAAELADPIQRFMQAWAAGDADALPYVLAEGVDANAVGGLNGAVELLRIDNIYVPELDSADSPRLTAVTVTWREPITGNELTQTYGVTVAPGTERWQITGIDLAPPAMPANPAVIDGQPTPNNGGK